MDPPHNTRLQLIHRTHPYNDNGNVPPIRSPLYRTSPPLPIASLVCRASPYSSPSFRSQATQAPGELLFVCGGWTRTTTFAQDTAVSDASADDIRSLSLHSVLDGAAFRNFTKKLAAASPADLTAPGVVQQLLLRCYDDAAAEGQSTASMPLRPSAGKGGDSDSDDMSAADLDAFYSIDLDIAKQLLPGMHYHHAIDTSATTITTITTDAAHSATAKSSHDHDHHGNDHTHKHNTRTRAVARTVANEAKEATEDDATSFDNAVRMLYDYIPVGASVLDVGSGWCGPAQLLRTERAANVTALTVSATQAAHCRSVGFPTIHANIEAHQFATSGTGKKKRKYDVAFLLESLSHVDDKGAVVAKLRKAASSLVIRVNCNNGRDHHMYFGSSMKMEPCDDIVAQVVAAGWKIKYQHRWGIDRAAHSYGLWSNRIMNSPQFAQATPALHTVADGRARSNGPATLLDAHIAAFDPRAARGKEARPARWRSLLDIVAVQPTDEDDATFSRLPGILAGMFSSSGAAKHATSSFNLDTKLIARATALYGGVLPRGAIGVSAKFAPSGDEKETEEAENFAAFDDRRFHLFLWKPEWTLPAGGAQALIDAARDMAELTKAPPLVYAWLASLEHHVSEHVIPPIGAIGFGMRHNPRRGGGSSAKFYVGTGGRDVGQVLPDMPLEASRPASQRQRHSFSSLAIDLSKEQLVSLEWSILTTALATKRGGAESMDVRFRRYEPVGSWEEMMARSAALMGVLENKGATNAALARKQQQSPWWHSTPLSATLRVTLRDFAVNAEHPSLEVVSVATLSDGQDDNELPRLTPTKMGFNFNHFPADRVCDVLAPTLVRLGIKEDPLRNWARRVEAASTSGESSDLHGPTSVTHVALGIGSDGKPRLSLYQQQRGTPAKGELKVEVALAGSGTAPQLDILADAAKSGEDGVMIQQRFPDKGGSVGLLVSPAVSSSVFFDEFFRRKVLHIQRPTEAQRFTNLLLGPEEMRSVVEQVHKRGMLHTARKHHQTRLLGNRHGFPRNVTVDEVLSVPHSGGASVVVSLTDVINPSGAMGAAPQLEKLVADLSDTIGTDVGVNLYVSAPNDKVLPYHTDRYDVIVVQLKGTKAWTTCVPRPKVDEGRSVSSLSDADRSELHEVQIQQNDGCSTYRHHGGTNHGGHVEDGDDDMIAVDADPPNMDCQHFLMGPGDSLYMPKGIVHAARTGPASTAHLTMSLTTNSFTWASFFAYLVKHTSTKDACTSVLAARNAMVNLPQTVQGLPWRRPLAHLPTLRRVCNNRMDDAAARVGCRVESNGVGEGAVSSSVPESVMKDLEGRFAKLLETTEAEQHFADEMEGAGQECRVSRLMMPTAGARGILSAKTMQRVTAGFREGLLSFLRETVPGSTTSKSGVLDHITKGVLGGKPSCQRQQGQGTNKHASSTRQLAQSTGSPPEFMAMLGRGGVKSHSADASRRRLAITMGAWKTTCKSSCSGCWTENVSPSCSGPTKKFSCDSTTPCSCDSTYACSCDDSCNGGCDWLNDSCDNACDGCATCGDNNCDIQCGDNNCDADGYACQCPSCPAGQKGTNGFNCATCLKGNYCTGGNVQTRCTAGKVSPSGSTATTACSTCAAGKYASWDKDTCSSCSNDKKYSAASAQSCSTCPTGSYTSGGSSSTHTDCTACSKGYSCNGGNTQTQCLKGTYAAGGAGSCVACNLDTSYAASKGASECLTCASGSYTSGGSLPLSGHTACTTCPSGYSCNGGSTRTKCPAGTYASGGASTCSKCDADNRFSAAGSSTCSTCGTGSFTAGGGADGKNRATCTQCPPGYTCVGTNAKGECAAGKYSFTGSSVCTNCGADTLYSAAKSGSCSTCKVGSFTSGGGGSTWWKTRTTCTTCTAGSKCDGTHTLVTCGAGYFSASGAQFCTQCGSDSKYSSAGAGNCDVCPAGRRTSGGSTSTHTSCSDCTGGYTCDGTSSEDPCPAGTFSKSKADVCTACGNDNTYSGATQATSCLTCAPGSRTTGGNAAGRTGCVACAKGYSCDGNNAPIPCGSDSKYSAASAPTCSTCPAGSQTNGGSSSTRTECALCPAGSQCDGSSVAQSCPAGKYSAAGAGTCSDCGAGNKYQPRTGQDLCKTCSALQYTHGGGPTTRLFCEPCPNGATCDGTSVIVNPPASCTCTNACGSKSNGVCEDSGEGSFGSACALGTDCADCGYRCPLYTTECPDGWSYQHMKSYNIAASSTSGGLSGHFCFKGSEPSATDTFTEAGVACQALNTWKSDRTANLVTPMSEAEWTFAKSLCRGDTCWLGFSDDSMPVSSTLGGGPIAAQSGVSVCCKNVASGPCTDTDSRGPRNGPWFGVDGTTSNGNNADAATQCQTDMVSKAPSLRISTLGSGEGRFWSPPWATAQPDNGNGAGEGCLQCYDGCSKWRDTSCSFSSNYICKMPANIPAGHFNKGSAPVNTVYGPSFDIAKCPKGTFNDEVQPPTFTACDTCVEGRYGDSEGITSAACSGLCAQGYYCPAGSTDKNGAPAGGPCPAGRYGATSGLTTSLCDGECPAGYYCAAGSIFATATKCKAGHYGDTAGQKYETCVGACPAGYYCPAGTSVIGSHPTTGGSTACTDPKFYCPEGSGAPVVVPSGAYSVDASGKSVEITGGRSVRVSTCSPGTYCAGGSAKPCPAGKYGSSSGLRTVDCSGDCAEGYYCPQSSKSPLSEECGSVANIAGGEAPTMFFCPLGSGYPTTVNTGHYTSCAVAGASCPETRRTKQLVCEAGMLCVRGVQTRHITWDESLCSCTFDFSSGSAVDNCAPAAALTVDGSVMLPEQPAQNTPPYGSAGALSFGRAITAKWMTDGGVQSAVTNFEIKNVAGSASPCTATTSTFALNGASAVLQLDYQLNFEDCAGWTFDLVATSGAATPTTSTCRFTVAVTNQNDGPYWTEPVSNGNRYGTPSGGTPTLTSRSLSEKAAVNVIVDRVLAADDDVGQQIEYEITAGNSAGMFKINSCSGDIYVQKSGLDYTIKPSYTLALGVKDSSNMFGSSLSIGATSVTIDLVDVNDPPIICSDSSAPQSSQKYGECTQYVDKFSIYEDAKELVDTTDPVLSSVYVKDPDLDSLVFSIENSLDGAIFDISAITGKIVVAAGQTLDYETKRFYFIDVVVKDQSGGVLRGGTTKHQFTVNVLDANDPPSLPAGLELNINENSQVGAKSIDSFVGTDPDGTAADLTYTIKSQSALDGTTLDPTKPIFKLVQDGTTGEVSVEIVAMPTSGGFDYESCQASSSRSCSFQLELSVTDKALPDVDGTCGSHCTAKTIDAVLAVTIKNVNEAPALLTKTVDVSENKLPGELIVALNSTDPENNDLRTLQFLVENTRELGAGGDCTPGGKILSSNFLSVTANGLLESRIALDYETMSASHAFCVEVRVQDSGGLTNALAGNAAPFQGVRINVIDVIEPPSITSGQKFTVREDAGTSVVVGKVVVTDPDAVDAGKVELRILSGNEFGGDVQFEIADAKTHIITVATTANLDYERKSSYSIEVLAQDSVGLSVTTTVTVDLEDVNESPVVTPGSSFTISEHNDACASSSCACTKEGYCLPGTELGIVSATDQDYVANKPETFTFSFSAGNADGTFAVDPTSGAITVAKITTNLKTRDHIFSLAVVATDSRGKASAPVSVSVTVVEKNFAPIFSAMTFGSIPENTGGMTSLGTFTITDPDKDYPLKSVIVTATNPTGFIASFKVAPGVGVGVKAQTEWELIVDGDARSLDFETIRGIGAAAVQGRLCLTMLATDKGGAASSYANYCIQVSDINEAPFVQKAELETAENIPASVAAPHLVGQLTVTDVDAADKRDTGAPLTFAVDTTGWDNPCPFTLTSVPCVGDSTQSCADVKLTSTLDFESLATKYAKTFDSVREMLTVSYTVTDSGANVVPGSFEVHIVDKNEPPSVTSPPMSVSENAVSGTTLGATMNVQDQDELIKELKVTVLEDAGVPKGLFVAVVSGTQAVLRLGGTLDFEDRSTYTVRLLVEDGGNGNKGEESRNSTATLVINVINENDVSVTGVTYKNATATPGHPTVGGDKVIITGTNFGPTQRKRVDEGAIDPTLKIQYGPSGGTSQDLTATGCTLTAGKNTEMTCTTAPLDVPVRGSGLTWTVTVDTDTSSPSISTTSYLAPSITGVVVNGGVAMPTRGGASVTITGTNLGRTPTSFLVAGQSKINYGYDLGSATTPKFNAVTCAVASVAHDSVVCVTEAGVGSSLQWLLAVGGQDSNAWQGAEGQGYDTPTLTTVTGGTGVDKTQLKTAGGETVIINGTNLGPIGTVVGAQYKDWTAGVGASNSIVYNAEVEAGVSSCSVVVAHVTMECTTVSGVGKGLGWRVYVKAGDNMQWSSRNDHIGGNAWSAKSQTSCDGDSIGTSKGKSVFACQTECAADSTCGCISYITAESGQVPGHRAGAWQGCELHTGTNSSPNTQNDAYVKNAAAETSYKAPTMLSLDGANIKELRTEGGQEVLIRGEEFGPTTPNSWACGDERRPVVKYGALSADKKATELDAASELVATCCSVLGANLVSCESGEGVGRGHSWHITVGKQRSNVVKAAADVGYGSPVVSMYSGPGAIDADTQGGQTIVISGVNFGPIALPNGNALSAIGTVTYGPDGDEYVLTAICNVTKDHVAITCKTTSGAGAGMNWRVSVDGQPSVQPSTAYGHPVITGISGPVALDTDGAQVVVITGRNFAPSEKTKQSPVTGERFLHSVVYGPSANPHYTLPTANCKVTKDSTEITCTTVPGVGSDLTWFVTVEGQLSAPFAWGSYEAPTISTASPLAGSTEGKVAIVLSGFGFGAMDPTSTVQVRFGKLLLGSKDGVKPLGGIDIATGTRRDETITFQLPELTGPGIGPGVLDPPEKLPITVEIKAAHLSATLKSQPVYFAYDKPKVNLLTTKQVSSSLMQITIRGENFCTGTDGCGVVFVEGVAVSADSISEWTHKSIIFTSLQETGGVLVKVGGQQSIVWRFSKDSPILDDATIAQLKSARYNTKGGDTVVLRGRFFGFLKVQLQVLIGGSGGTGGAAAEILTFVPGATLGDISTLTVKIPAGQGKNVEMVLKRDAQYSDAAYISYKPPKVDGLQLTASRSALTPFPTKGGADVTIQGSNFGTAPVVLVGETQATLKSEGHFTITFTVPPGVGKGLPIKVVAGNQNSIPDPNSVNIPSLSYMPPTVAGFALNANRRRRARSLLAVANCSATPPDASTATSSMPQVGTKGGECVTVFGTNFGNSKQKIMFGTYAATVTGRDTVDHAWLTFVIPEGEGKDIVFRIMVGNQDVATKYSYLPPTVSDLAPRTGSTSGLGVDGQKILVTVTGSNFGRKGGNAREVRITPPAVTASAVAAVPFMIRVEAEAFVTDTHDELQFFLPEGYGQGDTVTVFVGNQTSTDVVTFDYTVPSVTKITPYCGKGIICQAPYDEFETDGCSALAYWEEYNAWQARRGGAQTTVLGNEYERMCGPPSNDRWQMAIIEGTSLGSSALAATGAPLRISVTAGGKDDEVFYLSPGDCPECEHTHTRIVARSAKGYGRNLNLTVALGNSVSNPLNWSFKAPKITRVDSAAGGSLVTNGADMVVVRGTNMGRSGNVGTMQVRVFFGVEYDMLTGAPIGFKDPADGTTGGTGLIEGVQMKECGMPKDGTADKTTITGSAQWLPSYNYSSVESAVNVDGFPYIVCIPQTDVVGPKNMTVYIGNQKDDCSTNYGLCADPVSLADRRRKLPEAVCRSDIIFKNDSRCLDSNAFCSWDCFTSSIFVSKCKSSEGDTSYARDGELCADVNSVKAACLTKDCLEPSAKKGFYRLTADLNCTKETPGGPCKKKADAIEGVKNVDWIRPEEAKRAIARCPKERWEPLTDPAKYKEFAGLQSAAFCYDMVSCSPAKACLDDNVCSEGYQYTKFLCEEALENIGEVNCTTSDECRTMDKEGNIGKLPLRVGQALSNEPQSQSRCVQQTDKNTGRQYGRCECFTSPRCSLCTVSNYQGGSGNATGKDGKYFSKGYFRLNGKCEECDENPWILIGGFFIGIVGLCIAGYFLSGKQFNVAFISIGIDYLQILALFSRAEIQWPALMRKMFEIFSLFNFNIDIVQPECLIPNLDYRWKWYFTMTLPIGAFILLTLMFVFSLIAKKVARRSDDKHMNAENWNKTLAMFTMAFYYIYLSVTRRALDIFNCNPSIPSDGYSYTQFTSVACEGGLCKCNEPGTVQQFLVPFALTGLIVYSIGFPAFIGYIVYRHRDVIVEDQIMRAHGLATTRKMNAAAYHISQRWHKMYYHFKPDKVYWIVLIIIRKLAIAFVGLMLRTNPGFQLACCLLIMFICYILQVRYKPYMSMIERRQVIKNHRDKATAWKMLNDLGESKPADINLHHQIACHMETAIHAQEAAQKDRTVHKLQDRRDTTLAELRAGKCCKKRTCCATPEDELDMTESEREAKHRRQEKEYYFDYNTVEATLLACAVMVCLAGVLFENDRFDEAALLANPALVWQQELITYIVMLIVLVSLIYYCVVFVSEVFGYTPKMIKEKLCGCCNKSQRSLSTLTSPAFGGRARHGKMAQHSIDMVELTTNPLQSGKAKQTLQRAKTEAETKAADQLQHSANLLRSYKTLKKDYADLQAQVSRSKSRGMSFGAGKGGKKKGSFGQRSEPVEQVGSPGATADIFGSTDQTINPLLGIGKGDSLTKAHAAASSRFDAQADSTIDDFSIL